MPRLSEAARHLVYPSTITSSVFPLVERRLASVGVQFDPWQQGFGSIALGCRADGKFAATVGGVVASIPRQVGKTFTVGNLLIGLALEFDGFKIIWTSHHLRTTTATFRSMQGMVRRKAIAAHLDHNGIRTANGEQEIRFRNGSIIMFGARAQGFGRGMAEIDVEVFDEAQILSLKALEDMVPATNQARNPHGGLIFFIGTPPRPDDDGEAFNAKRNQALKGNADDDMVYVELSADSDADLLDREQWRKANPSYPFRTPLESMLRMRKNIPDDGAWRREALGIWDSDSGASLISRGHWRSLMGTVPDEGAVAYGVKYSPDGARVSVAIAIRPDEGPVFVESLGVESTAVGSSRIAAWLAERWRTCEAIVIDGKSGAGALVDALQQLGVRTRTRRVKRPTTDEVISAHATFVDAVREGGVEHAGQEGLEESIACAGRRDIGQLGGWGFQPITADGDVTAAEAVVLAHFGVNKATNRRSRESGQGRSGVVM